MKKLPVGISTFSQIIENDFIYVDKTLLLKNLIDRGKYFFLSRPRRFGKSVLVDTIKELFEGNKPLFEGLHIENHWNWDIHYPVVSISFAKGIVEDVEHLQQFIEAILDENQSRLGLNCEKGYDMASYFSNVIGEAKKVYGQNVVVLVDEYDKPLLDNLADEKAGAIRDALRSFYSVIKDQDANVQFAFLTGVSKFSKVSVFSGLNNLRDITLSKAYSALCGYTQEELEHCFAEYLQETNLERVKQWYNGYNWTGEKVYNPFDILLFLEENQEFRPYWFETGTPTFLLELLKASYYHVPDFENLEASGEMLNSFDIDNLKLEAVLFQTGYLTIKEVNVEFEEPIYLLGFPNREVRNSFNKIVLENYLLDASPDRLPVLKTLQNGDLVGLKHHLISLFEGIANDNYRKNSIAKYEGYYASVLYAFFASLSVDVIAEDVTSRGRIDMTLKVAASDGNVVVYIFEFKVVGKANATDPLEQIKLKSYADKYASLGTVVHLVGIEFDKSKRSIATYKTETISV